jgi:hypothetical protein
MESSLSKMSQSPGRKGKDLGPNIFAKANLKKEVKAQHSKLNQQFVNISGYGLHSCQKNSLIKVHPSTEGIQYQDLVLYTRGNQVILFDFKSSKKLDSCKMSQEMLVVIKQSTTYIDQNAGRSGFVQSLIACCGSTMQQLRGRIYANKFVACTYDGHIIVFTI